MLAKATPVLPAENMERAKSFYTEKLGLSILFEMPEGTLFACEDGTSLFVYPHERSLATHTAVSFIVENVLTEVARLRELGVVFEEYDNPGLKTENGIPPQEDVSTAFFTDTEGNTLGVVQM
jgi:catechol 2,3-dioxygenase-like lactoylglutathione lyase family enzyme